MKKLTNIISNGKGSMMPMPQISKTQIKLMTTYLLNKDDLDIDISGRSNLNTKISVPIKYGDGTSEISFLKFTNNSEDSLLNRGLELSLDLDLNENALIEIIFDENTNSTINKNELIVDCIFGFGLNRNIKKNISILYFFNEFTFFINLSAKGLLIFSGKNPIIGFKLKLISWEYKFKLFSFLLNQSNLLKIVEVLCLITLHAKSICAVVWVWIFVSTVSQTIIP